MGLAQTEEGTPLSRFCRKMELTERAFCCLKRDLKEWRREKAEGRKLQLPGEGNRKLKQLVADPDTCLVEDYHE